MLQGIIKKNTKNQITYEILKRLIASIQTHVTDFLTVGHWQNINVE